MKIIWHDFVECHKYRGKWHKGWLATSIAMEMGIAMMVTGGIFLGIGFFPWGRDAGVGIWLIIGGIFAFVLSCFEITENYPATPPYKPDEPEH